MDRQQFTQQLIKHTRSMIPLLRYLVLQTETHAFCLALACAALLGFFPFCVLLLSIARNVLRWPGAFDVGIAAVQAYFPSGQDIVIRNLHVAVDVAGGRLSISSVFWVFLGAAGVFIPLEAGLNRLWKVEKDRPYWRNQIVGFTLTVACCFLALAFIALNALIRAPLNFIIPFELLQTIINVTILKVTGIAFFIIAIFVFYKFLPNRRIDTMQVLPAAILAGLVGAIVKEVFVLALPFTRIDVTQGPFDVSISFVLLAYFETFVVLGGAFLSTQSEAYPWMAFMTPRKKPDIPNQPIS